MSVPCPAAASRPPFGTQTSFSGPRPVWTGLALPSAHSAPETGLSLLLGCNLGFHARNLTQPRWGRQPPLHRPKRAGSLGWRLPRAPSPAALLGRVCLPTPSKLALGPSAGAAQAVTSRVPGGGLNAEAPVGVQGPQLAGMGTLGPPRLTSCSHCPRPPSPSDLRCVCCGEGVLRAWPWTS